ncbi:MAG: sensor histidine kinase [Candidatus Loosdrechtia sp.]|uniref:sensor histidine kinase n=1 Tax=Candidatus Loosdrechtia sp. TaxID=3101272 RepID=UPI003A713F88|nr:MAG: ATP-binding protein [Candidatus Jettenia sp. AMX2]
MRINTRLQMVLFLICSILLSITGFLVWNHVNDTQPGLFIQILAGISILVLFLSHGMLRSTAKSIRELKKGTEIIGNGNLNYRIRLQSKDELGQLALSFNKMTESLQKTTISRDYSDSIIQSIIGGLIILSPDWNIKDVNNATCEMLGYEENELIGTSIDKILAEVSKFKREGMKDLTDNGFVKNAEGVFLSKDGGHIPVLFSGSVMHNSGTVSGMVFVVLDITEQKRIGAKQIQLLSELKSANRELNDFAYVVSHDLKAPLRSISSLAGWIVSDYGDRFDDEGKKQMDLLINRVHRMNALIEGILQYSRAGRVKEEKGEMNLNTIVKNVIDLINPPKNIEITIQNELPVISCESICIEQVFQNLLSNAVKYTDKPEGKIQIACCREGSYWRFSIADNGPGIEEKYFEKIFQIFQKLKSRDEVEGTGIGLSIVKKIVGMYGGKVWLESKVGYGSTFFFTLPVHSGQVKKANT